ncbi:ATP-binding protein [Simkania negevensis]|uniref:histidine kinase n=1 Tax=Simkania negevensis TaxID=83561 RepID=A0ABS3ASK5_9BACT|nr:ATP-binding protein [Simkania negevensis]
MIGFVRKIFIVYVIAFAFLLILLFPFVQRSVDRIINQSLEERSKELLSDIGKATSYHDLYDILRERQRIFSFAFTVYNATGKVLFDSRFPYPLDKEIVPVSDRQLDPDTPEYGEEYLPSLNVNAAFLVVPFEFKGDALHLKIIYPLKQIESLVHDFQTGFLSLGALVLLLFGAMTWMVVHHMTRPIQQIINAIKPYQQGAVDRIPAIKLPGVIREGDLGKLADTLNRLTDRIDAQIDTLVRERNEKEAILETLLEGVIAVDKKMTVTYANSVAVTMLSTTKEEIYNKPFSNVNQSECHQLLEISQKENSVVADEFILDGPRDIFVHTIAIPQNSNMGAILILQDKTKQHRVEKMGSDFVANASHELKTPITIIRGFAETLHDHPDLPRATSLDITQKIVSNCERMTKLIKNLLTLSDTEELPASRLVEVNIRELAQRCFHTIQNLYPTAQLTINAPQGKGVFFITDPDLIELALINLLANAAKYSAAPAQITLDIKRSTKAMTIAVKDQGIGIPEEDIDLIFTRFYTVNRAHSRKLGGSGLGLSIVKTAAKKLRGKIEVTSEEGEGSTFILTIPVIRR